MIGGSGSSDLRRKYAHENDLRICAQDTVHENASAQFVSRRTNTSTRVNNYCILCNSCLLESTYFSLGLFLVTTTRNGKHEILFRQVLAQKQICCPHKKA